MLQFHYLKDRTERGPRQRTDDKIYKPFNFTVFFSSAELRYCIPRLPISFPARSSMVSVYFFVKQKATRRGEAIKWFQSDNIHFQGLVKIFATLISDFIAQEIQLFQCLEEMEKMITKELV